MQWIQVIVVHSLEHSALYVDDMMCIIPGTHTLSQSYITNFDDGLNYRKIYPYLHHMSILVTVEPPTLPIAPPPETLSQYNLLYIGGLPRYTGTNLRRYRRQSNRRSYYGTAFSSILGCMRGFRVGGDLVDLRRDGIRPTDNSKLITVILYIYYYLQLQYDLVVKLIVNRLYVRMVDIVQYNGKVMNRIVINCRLAIVAKHHILVELVDTVINRFGLWYV
jgi:hypothetical protein